MSLNPSDPIVEAVIQSFRQRSEQGIKKYKTTLAREDLKTLEWIQHTQEELMDAILYLERLKKDFNRINPQTQSQGECQQPQGQELSFECLKERGGC
jgi:hypothetical protein